MVFGRAVRLAGILPKIKGFPIHVRNSFLVVDAYFQSNQ